MPYHRFIRGLVFIALLLCSVSLQAQADGTLFGVVEGYYRPDHAAALGVSWERTTFYWYHFQPNSPADFDTNAVQVDASLGAGRQVVGVIKGTPAWEGSSSPAAV